MSTSSSSLSDSSSSSSSSCDFLDELREHYHGEEIQGYMFQPTKIVHSSSSSDLSSSESSVCDTRLQNSDW